MSLCSTTWVHIAWDVLDALWSSWSGDWEGGLLGEGLEGGNRHFQLCS